MIGNLPPASYKNVFHFIGCLAATTLIVAISAATIGTIFIDGLGILQNGFHTATLALETKTYALFWHPPITCAIAEIVMLLIALPVFWLAFPRLLRQFIWLRQYSLNRFK